MLKGLWRFLCLFYFTPKKNYSLYLKVSRMKLNHEAKKYLASLKITIKIKAGSLFEAKNTLTVLQNNCNLGCARG